MALRNAVKVALVSEDEEPLSRPRLDDRFVPRFEEHIAVPALAVIAAPESEVEPLADALLWWVKEQLWLSDEPSAAVSEPAPLVETPIPANIAEPVAEAPPPIDATPATQATSPLAVEIHEVESVAPPAPLEPEMMGAEPAADIPARSETPARIEEFAPMESPPAPAIVVERATEAPLEPEPAVNRTPQTDENPTAPWRARAAAVRAMAATLPASSSRLVIGKIAALYDELADETAGEAETAARLASARA